MTLRARPLEKTIERKCVSYAENLGWISIKLDKAKRGWPDRLFVGSAARTFFVEFKRPGERRRKQQIGNHQRLDARGHSVEVIDSYDDFVELMAKNGYDRN